MFDAIINACKNIDDMAWFNGASRNVQIAIIIVSFFILIAALVSAVVSIILAVKYVKFNRRNVSCGMAGKDVARKVLDDNGLQNIDVKSSGSFLFGNSYSHYFKKVRLRRLTWKKSSLTAMAMAAEKSSLAILDKEGDKDMKFRVALTPFIYFGPVMCLPIIILGIVIDYFLCNFTGIVSVVAICIGLAAYLASFVMSLLVIKTETKAQKKAIVVMKQSGLATGEELNMMQELYTLYNVQYVVDMIIALLEIILRILQIVAIFQGSSSSSSSSK